MTRHRNHSIDKEAEIIDAQLTILRTREADFQRTLDGMQRLKDSLSLERQGLDAKGRALQNERQPINWLPPELLIHIFVSFTDANAGRDADSYNPTDVCHRAPIIISHVSSRWRSIALGTSRMWSRVSVQSAKWNPAPLTAFLARSCSAPLDIVFISRTSVTCTEEEHRAKCLLTCLSPEIHRIRSVTFHSRNEAMKRLIRVLTHTIDNFSSLRDLDLSIVSLGPPHLASPTLVPAQLQGSGARLNLTYLRLKKLPLFNMPKHFLSNLMVLALSFPPKKSTAEGPNSYMLRLSLLCPFLDCTPKLQELVLSNTAPFVDVYLNAEDAVHLSGYVHQIVPVELAHLHTIEWTYPFDSDIHYFLHLLTIPALQRMDICVDESPVVRGNILLLRGYSDDAASALFARQRVIEPRALCDLKLQWLQDDTIDFVWGKFTFPMLEQLELTHVGIRWRAAGADRLPIFPPLESLFWNPQFPTLTHLTICGFEVAAQVGEAKQMLGHIPALMTLMLNGCTGIRGLLDALQQYAACPHLATLALWNCTDVNIILLVDIVVARNGSGGDELGNMESIPSASSAAGSKETPKAIPQTKKLCRLGQRVVRGGPSHSKDISSNTTGRPARISHVLIGGCELIKKDQAMVLKTLGVAHVVWSSD